MAHRRKWYEQAILDYLQSGGADGLGGATARQLKEMLQSKGKKQVPTVGGISHTLRGIRDPNNQKVIIEVGKTKVARGDSRVRGYLVSVWGRTDNAKLERLKIKYALPVENNN
jgi:hypothetical protein